MAFLAAASLGAIWTSCPPDFGPRAVIDRLSQVDPTVLLAVDGYCYGAQASSRLTELVAIRRELPSLRAVVLIPYLDEAAEGRGRRALEGTRGLSGPAHLRGAALCPPALHPVLVGHHWPAQRRSCTGTGGS